MTQSSQLSITFAVMVIAAVAVSFLLGFLPEGMDIPIYGRLILSQALVALPAWYFMKSSHRDFKRTIPRRGFGLWTVLCLIAFVFAVQPLMAFLNYISSLFFGSGTDTLVSELIPLPALTNLLFIALIPAFCEETVFRGIFFQGFRKHGFWKSMLVSGLFFGLMHLNWNQFSYGFVLGVLFAFLTEATGSIRAPILVHFGINFESVMTISSYREIENVEGMLEEGESLLYGFGFSALYGSYLFLAAAVSAGLCALLIWVIAKANQRSGYMGWILRGGERRYLANQDREPLLSPALVTAILIPVIFMCLELVLQRPAP